MGVSTTLGKQQSGLYRLKFSRAYCWSLILFRFLPYYLYHFIRRPYRQGIKLIDYELVELNKRRNRFHSALYDTVFNFVLDGYTQLTGLRLAPGTGQVLVFLIELTRHLDEHLDRRRGTAALPDQEEVLELPVIQQQRAALREYLEKFGSAEPVLTYLRKRFIAYYNGYVRTLTTAKDTLHFDDVLKAAQLDTGLWLQSLMELIAVFNGHTLDAEHVNTFYLFGLAAKFVDDMVDLVNDMKAGHPNLLYALIRQNPVECASIQTAIANEERLNAAWWKENCPRTYTQYFEYLESYYNEIRSSRLRLVCDLLLLPAIVGLHLDSARSR